MVLLGVEPHHRAAYLIVPAIIPDTDIQAVVERYGIMGDLKRYFERAQTPQPRKVQTPKKSMDKSVRVCVYEHSTGRYVDIVTVHAPSNNIKDINIGSGFVFRISPMCTCKQLFYVFPRGLAIHLDPLVQ